MRQTEARDTRTYGGVLKNAPKALARSLQLTAIALGIGLVMSAGIARAQDAEDDDKSFEDRLIEGMIAGIGGTNMDNRGIDYRERSPLVVPPTTDLPPPVTAAKEVNVPNWPKDPDEARRKAQIARRKKENKDPVEASRILSPSELNAGRTAAGSTPTNRVPQPGESDPGRNAILNPSQLGFDGRFSKLLGGSKAETATFTAEPTRDSLTMPPPGYQTPSSNFAYGTGPKESLNKEYNPAAGKYGE